MDLLDRLQSLDAIDSFDPTTHAAALEAELRPVETIADLELRDARLSRALVEIDELATRVMRIRLEHTADEMPVQTRRVFASTIASYAGRLDALEQRVRSTRVAEPTVHAVIAAARTTLEMRETLRAGTLALIQRVTGASIPRADENARDRQRSDAERKRWSQVRRDLEVIAASPERIGVAAMSARIAAWPEQLDEPAPEPEASLAELIELD